MAISFVTAYATFDAFISQYPFLSNKLFQFILIMLGFYLLSWLFANSGKSVLTKITSRTKTKADDVVIDLVAKPIYFLILLIGLKFALIPFQLKNSIAHYIALSNNSLIIAAMAYLALSITEVLCTLVGETWAKKTKSTIDDEIIPLVRKAAKVLIVIFALLMIMSSWGIEIGPFIASLGIAGIAIGFAVKDSLGNIFGGISLILDRAYKVGDPVELEDGTTGKIQDIGLRSTRIRTWNNELVMIPNGQMANSKIKNFILPDKKIRITIPFGVDYGTRVDKAKTVALKAINKVSTVSKDPEPLVRFEDMADSSLNFTAYFWVDDLSVKVATRDEVLTHLYNELNRHRIGIPYPTRTVYNKKG